MLEISSSVAIRVKKPNMRRCWISKEMEKPLENINGNDWVEIPKFLVFEVEPKRGNNVRLSASPEQEKVGDKTEVITFCISYSPKVNALLYGVSVKSPKDQTWLSYGKSVAKSRLRKLIEKKYELADIVPLDKYSNCVFPSPGSDEETIKSNIKSLAEEVYAHFINRIIQGDLINKFPNKIRNDLISGCFRLVAPVII